MSLFIEQFDALPPSHDLRAWTELHKVRRLYAQGKASERTPIPVGYYRNAITLALLALLILAYARGRTDLWLKAWLARFLKHRQSWQCTNCGYDITGLEQCPECGTPTISEGL